MNSAESLEGMVLPGDWTVEERLSIPPSLTPGWFSVGYRVRSANGTMGFLKALDFSRAFDPQHSSDPAKFLFEMTQMFQFERNVLEACKQRRMDRVVKAITSGTVTVPGGDFGGVVQYLIFEFAERDARLQLSMIQDVGAVWKLTCLHHVATGLLQLHRGSIAHQDLKPGNVLVFEDNLSKVGDLGRACQKGTVSPHEDLICAGDRRYAPPEVLYNHESRDWAERRMGCDGYLLGSLATYFFTGENMTAVLFGELDSSFHWRTWAGSYKDVLPYLREAFARSLSRLQDSLNGQFFQSELVQIVRELCDPDPAQRGDRINRERGTNPFRLERYVTRLDRLAKAAAARIEGTPSTKWLLQ